MFEMCVFCVILCDCIAFSVLIQCFFQLHVRKWEICIMLDLLPNISVVLEQISFLNKYYSVYVYTYMYTSIYTFMWTSTFFYPKYVEQWLGKINPSNEVGKGLGSRCDQREEYSFKNNTDCQGIGSWKRKGMDGLRGASLVLENYVTMF